MDLLLAGAGSGHLKSLQNRTGVLLAAAQIIDLSRPRRLVELEHKAGHVQGMDVVPHLLALVAVNLVFTAFEVAFDQVTEKPMQFDARMMRPRQAPAAQATSGQSEVTAILLHHDVSRHLGSAEERVLGLVNGKALW